MRGGDQFVGFVASLAFIRSHLAILSFTSLGGVSVRILVGETVSMAGGVLGVLLCSTFCIVVLGGSFCFSLTSVNLMNAVILDCLRLLSASKFGVGGLGGVIGFGSEVAFGSYSTLSGSRLSLFVSGVVATGVFGDLSDTCGCGVFHPSFIFRLPLSLLAPAVAAR